MSTLHQFAFWLVVACILIGAVLGVAGVWLPKTQTGFRLFMTDVVVAVSATLIAVVTKWLA